ncbi:histidine phosphatase superfamily [Dunaliella salina]|uniref:Histidine phosphatase superfamily n=1 Tax=Dunaliella salina TaxID=3046 RepID=A0ABQ7H3N3_DUNSA|nr:histidine phosphatase superfamily [Dunaliella salina]|eukprot:KAF5841484.1 histidine phosphatase superfamily [Dunaliella salina]
MLRGFHCSQDYHGRSGRSSRQRPAAAAPLLRPSSLSFNQTGKEGRLNPSASLLDPSHHNGGYSILSTGWAGPQVVPGDELAVLRSELQALRDQVLHLQQQQELGNRLLAQEMKRKLTKEDYDCLPHRIILLRHGESHGNVEKKTYCTQPDHSVGLTAKGRQQAIATGQYLRRMLEAAQSGRDINLFFMTSPYCRTLETTDAVMDAFENDQVVGLRQAVQLREQDFGNFQDPQRISQDLCDRNKFGRFWFRFPNGESGADVYDRLTIFEDHLTRDMFMGRFADTNLVLVTHGLTLRIFLMRWFHWSVDEFLQVYNPANCDPVVVEKLPWETVVEIQNQKYAHAKHVYYITSSSMAKLRGCQVDMCSYMPRHSGRIKDKWKAQRKRTGPPTATSSSMPNPAYSDVPGQAQYPPFSDALHPQVPSPSGRKSPQPPVSPSQQHYSLSRPPTPYSNGVVPQYVHQHHLSSEDNEIALGHYQQHLQHLGDSNILPRHGFKNKEMAQRQLHDSVLLEQQQRRLCDAGLQPQPQPPQPPQQHLQGEAQNAYNAATVQ